MANRKARTGARASGTANQPVTQHAGASTTKGGSVRKPSGGTENQGMTGTVSEGRRPSVSAPLAGTANAPVTQHAGASTAKATPGTPPIHALMQSHLPSTLKAGEPLKQLNVDGALSIVKGGGGGQ